jgi:hypothetical protein
VVNYLHHLSRSPKEGYLGNVFFFFFSVLGFELRASYLLGRHSALKSLHQSQRSLFKAASWDKLGRFRTEARILVQDKVYKIAIQSSIHLIVFVGEKKVLRFSVIREKSKKEVLKDLGSSFTVW